MLQAFRAVGGLAAVLPRASAPGLAYLSTSYVHHHHPCMLHQHHHHHQQQQQQQQQQQRIGDAAVGRSFSTVPNQIALIKALREKSGAPISDIKACLEACGWDTDAAYDALRKKGLAAAAKKASRLAAEGLVGVAATAAGAGPALAVVEVNSETDFVSRSDVFRALVRHVAAAALPLRAAAGPGHEVDAAQLLSAQLDSGGTVSEAVASVAAQVRENVRMRRCYVLSAPPGFVIGHYLHMSPEPGLGSIACAVAIGPTAPNGPGLSGDAATAATELAAGIAMHGAGMRPGYLSRGQVPPEALDAERKVLTEQAAGSGKPAAVVAKMVEGRLSKFYEDSCLLEQKYLLDDAVKVQGAVGKCGEGLEAIKSDFAKEVAEMAAQ